MRFLTQIALVLLLASVAYAAELFSDDFETSNCSAEWDDDQPGVCPNADPDHYTPNTAETVFKEFPASSGNIVLNYYALSGTNEEAPVTLYRSFSPARDKICIVWTEHFVANYPWGTSSQKMLRCGNSAGGVLSFEVINVADNEAMQIQFFDLDGNVQGDEEWAAQGDPHPEGETVEWEFCTQLNTPGQADGYLTLKKNGVMEISIVDKALRDSGTTGFDFCWIGGNYSMLSGTLPASGSRYIDNVEFHDDEPEEEPTPTPTATPTATPTPTSGTPPGTLKDKCKCKGKKKR